MVPVTALELLFKLCWIAAKYSLCFHVYEIKEAGKLYEYFRAKKSFMWTQKTACEIFIKWE